MTKKNWWKILCLCVVSLLFGGCSLLDNLLFTKNTVPEFTFSGYVYADGKALEGALVDCGMKTTTTDQMGYYKFTGVNKVVQVVAEKEGYLFGDELVFVNSLSSDVNFNGYKLFNKSGIVKNNNVIVPNVDIEATSESGTFITKSNNNGEFYLSNLAGQVKVTASKESYNFFKQSFTIEKEDDIVVTGVTDIVGKIVTDQDECFASDFTLDVNGQKVNINDDLTFVATNVEPGSVFSLSSEKFHIDNSKITLGSEIEELVFNCEKYYNISGSIMSGETKLTNAKIVCGEREFVSLDGDFSFEKLYGENTLECVLENFTFDEIMVNAENTNLRVIGTTSISGKINLDFGQGFEDIILKVGNKTFNCDKTGAFTLSGVQFQEKLEVLSNTYHTGKSITLENRNLIRLNLEKLYSANITIVCDESKLENVCVKLNDVDYFSNADGEIIVENLYGKNSLFVSKDGYKFDESYNIDFSSSDIQIQAYELYNISGTVKSGDILLQNANVVFGENNLNVDENANFEIVDAFGIVELKIISDGYNEKIVLVDKNSNNQNINLTYNISGTITCGESPVEDVDVSANNLTTKTNKLGVFVFENLEGEVTIACQKDFYSIPSQNVSKNADILIPCSYNINGNLSKKSDNGEGVDNLVNFLVILADKETGDTIETYTDEMGNYTFSNLTSTYALFYDMNTTLSLKPKHYDVSLGGRYDFSNNGYGFGGVVTCGGNPLEDVVVRVGTLSTKTNEYGEYSFGLVTSPGVVTLEKEGYTFQGDGHDGRVDDKVDGRDDVNFVSTYKVCGVVKSGNVALAGVKISIGSFETFTNENGAFEIANLIGQNSITLRLDEYKFEGNKNVSGYERINYIASMDILAKVISGDIKVSGLDVYVDGKKLLTSTDTNGEIILSNIQLGSIITFEKEGYFIESKTIDALQTSFETNATYKVSGTVSNCGTPLGDVTIKVLGTEISIQTDVNGYFEITNLIGTQTLSFEKTGFEFENKIITGAENLNILSKFSVEGYVKIGGKVALAGVQVTAGTLSTTTDKFGKFKIEGLTTPTLFEFTLEGYDFGGPVEVSTPNQLNISATFKITGRVKSGTGDKEIIIANARIETLEGLWCLSDDEGRFEITGISQATTITITADGYNAKSIAIEKYEPLTIANLDYNVDLIFSGLSDNEFSDIIIKVNNSASYTCSSSAYTLKGLKGENLISFTKTNCAFTPSEIMVSMGTSEPLQISILQMYNISGTVKTANNLPIAYATVYAGADSTTTDVSGNYSFNSLSGTRILKAVIPSFNPTSDQEQVGAQVSSAGTYDIVISDAKFTLNFLNYAYDRLRNAMSYQIFGTGTVTPNISMAGTQQVSLVYKQDKNGNKVFENKNTGDEIKIASVDPNVSLLSYYDTKTGMVKFQQINGKDNVQGGVKYTSDWSGEMTRENYLNNYGVNMDNFSPYVINNKTISSVKNFTLNNSNEYQFTLVLSCDESSGSYSYYKKLMSVMCSKQSLENFTKIELTFRITQDGYLRQMVINEIYNVTSTGVTATVTAGITYNFYINSMTEIISDIDVTSPITATQNINTLETPVETLVQTNSLGDAKFTNQTNTNKTPKINLINFKKEELLWKN